MESQITSCDRTRAYPASDAQGHHPALVTNGLGLSHHNGRVRRKKRVQGKKEIQLRLGNWNVGTMTGRGRELAEVLKRRRINVACLQETKWKGSKARELGEGYKFFYCGSDGKRNGVGIVLDNQLKECVMNVNRVSDRVIAIKLMIGGIVLNIVSVYAPQSGCDDRMKERFWEEFETVLIDIRENEEVVVGGDFNGHVGKSNVSYERVHGGLGFGHRNKEGEALLLAAAAFDLAVANTWFKKTDGHLATYKSGRSMTQIDYFLVKRNKLNCVKNCKVLPGEDLVSQHRLLILQLKLQPKITTNVNRAPPKVRWHMLEKDECADKFREQVMNGMMGMTDMNDKSVNECWNEMASLVRNVAKCVLGESKGKGVIDRDTWWWDERVQKAVKDKKLAFKRWQGRENLSDSEKHERKEIYIELKKRAKRVVAVAKAEAQDKLYSALDGPSGQKRLYKIAKARERNGRDMLWIRCIKDENGKVLINDDEIKGRWKAYFERLMNEENRWSGSLNEPPPNESLVRNISMTEVREAIRGMKNGRAVGPDGIPVEVWKLLSVDGCMWLTLFFNKLLQQEIIPTEWNDSVLVPIFKNKGDVQECNSYRGIKLMSHTMKIWEKVIERRLREESEITQNQFGFMPGRGTTDAIFALRQLSEKYRRAHKNLHMVFVDLEKAYDRVPRMVLWWALKEKGVPVKYMELIRAMYIKPFTCVRSAAGTTDKFNVAVGLHQGSALSPYLFLLVMDALTSNIQDQAPWCMLFADDIVLVGENGHEVQNRLVKWQQKLESVGLKISRTKSEYLFCDFGGCSDSVPMTLDGVNLPVCSDFKYLGSIIQSDGEIDRDVKHRISAGWMKWRQVTGTTCDPRLPLKLKGKIYKTIIRPAVMYGSECWAVKGSDERRMNATEMRMLRWMCGVTKIDKIRNEYIRGSLKVAPIVERMRSNRLGWYGHVMRKDESHITRQALNMNVDGYKGRGRPKKVWMDCVKADMKRTGVSKEMAEDRHEWRESTYCADPE